MKFGSIDGEGRDLTVEDAADILNVSVDHVIDLLDRGELPCRSVEAAGGSTRLLSSPTSSGRKGDRHEVLDELTTEAKKHRRADPFV